MYHSIVNIKFKDIFMGYLFLNLCVGCVDLVKYCECILLYS